jgi:hypothetical protein
MQSELHLSLLEYRYNRAPVALRTLQRMSVGKVEPACRKYALLTMHRVMYPFLNSKQIGSRQSVFSGHILGANQLTKLPKNMLIFAAEKLHISGHLF